VHHLVSAVTGQLSAGATAVDLLRACFPGGSITGAPKIRAMEVIQALEPGPRGPYCGTLAWLGFDGAMDSSIVIRSLVGDEARIYAQAGGGIVADSDPALEYAETMTKAAPLLAALTGTP
jgi:para-aminobenzoate synthetase component 1